MRSLAFAVALAGAPNCLVEYTVGAPADPSDKTCPEGQVVCGDDCAAPDACPCDDGCDRELEVCEDGACRCRPGLVRCGDTCVDTRANAAHCGGCDSPCGDGTLCQASDCVAQCDAPKVACGKACVDLSTDALHCDECGHRCRSDEMCSAADCRRYVALDGCTTCPCDACGDDDGVCCDAPFLGGPACIEGKCS
jgi:hypothetical protein